MIIQRERGGGGINLFSHARMNRRLFEGQSPDQVEKAKVEKKLTTE